jgi:putative peptidoglycan lipid II flippase
MTALLPAMSGRWAERDRTGFSQLLTLGMRSTAFIVIPAALGYIALAKPIVFATLQHGATGPASAALVARILVCFAIGLPFYSAFQLFARAFYATQNSRAPALINLVATAINIVGNVILFPVMGPAGLALAFSLSYVFAAIFTFVVLRSWLPAIDGHAIASTIARTSLAAVVAAGLAYGASIVIGGGAVAPRTIGQILQVAAGVAVGGVAFVLLATLLRIPEVRLLRRLLPSRR